MNIKKNKPFVLRSKTKEEHDRKMKGSLHFLMLLFVLVIPFFNSGVLSFCLGYVENDVDLYPLELLLTYTIPLIAVAARYLSYAVATVSLIYFSLKGSKRIIIDYICGTFFTYLILSCTVFVLTTGQELFASNDGFINLFYSVTITVFTLLESAVLMIAGKRTLQKNKNIALPKNEKAGKLHQIFSAQNIIFRISRTVFGVLLIFEIILEFVQYTLPMILGGEADTLGVFTMIEGYAVAIVMNLIGLVIMSWFGTYLYRKVMNNAAEGA